MNQLDKGKKKKLNILRKMYLNKQKLILLMSMCVQ